MLGIRLSHCLFVIITAICIVLICVYIRLELTASYIMYYVETFHIKSYVIISMPIRVSILSNISKLFLIQHDGDIGINDSRCIAQAFFIQAFGKT